MPEHIYCICYLCELVCCKERVGKRKEGSEREREESSVGKKVFLILFGRNCAV